MIKFNNFENGGIKELKSYLNQFYFDKSTSYKTRILGIILICFGIISFYKSFFIDIRFGITLILIGGFMIFLISEKSTPISIDFKITLFLTSWVLIMYFLTGRLKFEIYIISIFLGILIIKELSDEFITKTLKKRITILILIFLAIYILFILEKIISFVPI